MSPPMPNSIDKTNFLQSLMHMIKGNFGTGILAMPASFNHSGLVNALVGLPLLCLIATYCVHLLVRSSQHLENKHKFETNSLEYSALAKGSFLTGPKWIRPYSDLMCRFVDATLILCQLGICCVYLVFIVFNIVEVLKTFDIQLSETACFLCIMPAVLLLSYIRTLKRLSIASGCANFLQIIGIIIIIEYLFRDMPNEPKVVMFKPASEVALGFGSAMFAFEGIGVVMPIYARMKRQEQMGGLCGVINLSYIILLALYIIVGLFGYLRFGSAAAGSITLDLPRKPLYEMVRAMFATSVFLSYPLQFYVLNEIVWNFICQKFLANEVHNNFVQFKTSPTNEPSSNAILDTADSLKSPKRFAASEEGDLKYGQYSKFEYACRTCLVLISLAIAMSVPKLNLMMDFFGSISGTSLSITLPPLIHLVAFWEDTSGRARWVMVILDGLIIFFGLVASANGSYFSLIEILKAPGGH